jgi:hypothetical protein
MFQYAAARALALHHAVEVALDDRLAIKRGERSITRIFNLAREKHPVLPPEQKEQEIRYRLWRYFGHKPKFYREAKLGFNEKFFDLPNNVYLHGYWQSEKYFSQIASTIRSDFAFPQATGLNADIAAHIAETNSVSLHLRRGDYLALAAHAVCDQSYYDAALSELGKDIKEPIQLFVFSDDPNWARENLDLPGSPVFIDHNGEDQDFEDMRLMSLCKHNVIANSSFSWWGAWLNQNPNRKVVAPKRWFGLESMSNPDIWAEGWTKV